MVHYECPIPSYRHVWGLASAPGALQERNERSGRKLADSTLGPHVIEVAPPYYEGPFCMAQVVEHFFVQQLVTQLASRAFAKAILLRLTWSDIVPVHVPTILPIKLGMRHKLCPARHCPWTNGE